MRILITSPILPPVLGGPSVLVPSLAADLASRGHQVTVLAFSDVPAPGETSYRTLTIARRALPLRYLHSFVATWREARRHDVLYVHEHLALAVLLAARLARKPAAVRVMVDGIWEVARRYGLHSDSYEVFQRKRYGPRIEFARWLQRRWWSWCDAIVAPSEHLQRLVLTHGAPPERVHRIANAHHGPRELAMTREQAREQLGLGHGRRVVLTVARLESWKGVDGLLRALGVLPPDYELHIVGDGEERANWEQLARRLGVDSRAHFVGAAPHASVAVWMLAADAFVLNTRYEGLSHTLIEAMWNALPIAVSEVCSNPELIEHGRTGLLFPVDDTRQIAACVRQLVEQPAQAQAMGRSARERARSEFDRSACFDRTEALLLELAAARRRRRG